jgi:uncharacterized protein YcfL
MLEPMSLYKAPQYNTSNFHKKAPFMFMEDTLILDTKFYQKIKGTWVDTQLQYNFINIEIHNNIVYGKDPKSEMVSNKENSRFFIVYRIFLRWYDADKWYSIIDDRPTELVSYSEGEKTTMYQISNTMIITGKSHLNESEKEDLETLIQILELGNKIFTKYIQNV